VRTAQAEADDRLSSVDQRTSSLRRSRLLGRTWVVTALAGALYLAFAIAVTWPLGLHPQSAIYGPVGSDLTASIGRFQEFVSADQPPFLPGTMLEVDAPDGLPTTWALDLAAFPNIAVHWGLSVAFGAIAANGVLALAAFTLCGLAMFLLARWLTGHAGAALIAGLAFGFWPWVFSTATQALGHGWVFVLLLWRALVVLERPTARNGVLVGLAAALCMMWFQYWILIGWVFYATLAVIVLLLAVARGEGRLQLRAQLAGFVPVAATGAFLAVLASAASAGEIPVRPESDAYSYSARLWMYLLPHPENPLLGSWSRSIADHRYADFTPDTPAHANIYLGWTVLLLAFVGVGSVGHALIRDRRRALRERRVVAGIAASATAFVALLFSAPPRVSVLGQEVPMPEELVLQATTAFRVTHRFALVVMLGVCVLAALGLRTLLTGRSATVAMAVVAVLAIAVPLDLWGRQVDGAKRVVYPRLYSDLKQEAPGIVAVYPLGPDSDNLAIFYRPSHGKPVLNGYRTGSETHPVKGDLQALADPGTVSQLAALGVRYVVVREDAASQPWHPRAGQRFRGLSVIQSTDDGTSFRVVAKPAPAIVTFGPGFYPSERTPRQFLRWMRGPRARIDVQGNCHPCNGRVRLTAASFARTRALVVRDESGAIRTLAYIGTAPTTVSFPVRFHGRASFFLSTRPGPESIAAIAGGTDPRVVSIQLVSPMRYIRERS
jgi:hypothetical protein